MKVWTPEQLRTFLDFVADNSHGSMLRLAALTGLRRAALCGLRWQDVDLDSARLVVRQAITTVDHEPTVGDVKSTRSRRVIDLDPATVNVLRAQRKQQLEERLLGGSEWVDSGLVFSMPDGRGWHPDVITRAFAGSWSGQVSPAFVCTICATRTRHTCLPQADAAAAVAALVDG